MTLLESLTERERQIASRITAGLTNSEIATDLYLSIDTIKTHIRTLYRKLEVRNRVEVVLRVLTDPDLEPLRPPQREWGKPPQSTRPPASNDPSPHRRSRPITRKSAAHTPPAGTVASVSGRVQCDGCSTEFHAPYGAIRIPGAAGTVSYYADGTLVHACNA